MKKYSEMSVSQLKDILTVLEQEYDEVKASGLTLDMSRGKPSPVQLDLSNRILETLNSDTGCISPSGIDCRNYGNLEGIPEARKLMGDIMGVPAEQVIVFGNASLNIMYDCIANAMLFGVMGHTPWSRLDKVKFLCPVPGYDRHFKITELMGIEMIPIPMTPSGPDMDLVEELVSKDDAIKGIWCVPVYSNPQGIVYSEVTVKRFAALQPAAADFRIYWDNAYAIHPIYEETPLIPEILQECQLAGNPNLVYEFTSTSKISYAGAGISAMAASTENLDWLKRRMTVQTIGYDKINQLRHVSFFKDLQGVKNHMKLHADILRPKFDAVLSILDEEIKDLGIGQYTKPLGGYFISFETLPGCARKVVAKCKAAGVVLTDAGATFPYGIDPVDTNIRIAPSYPSPDEMKQAAKLFALCVKIVSLNQILTESN